MPRWDSIFPASARPQREAAALGLAAAAPAALAGDRLFRLIVGRDNAAPVEMTAPEIEELDDPLARLVLRRGIFPEDAAGVTAALDAAKALPTQVTFLASEAGQIPATDLPIDRQYRFVVTRADGAMPDLVISTGAEGDPKAGFLQILAWDDKHGVFNYYQRIQPSTWIFSGNSNDSLRPPSRGHGAFDSHVNGSMVMKELLIPWQNWDSFKASIDRSLGDAAMQQSPFLKTLMGAENLESVVASGIHRWTEARFDAIAAHGSIADPTAILRQAIAGTTFNLRTTLDESAVIADGDEVGLPATFFLDIETFTGVLGIPVSAPELAFSGRRYRRALDTFGFHLRSGGFTQAGDTFFAFLFPEPALEDRDALAEAVAREWIDPRVAACALMVDFANPVRSPRRMALLSHLPATAALDAGALGSEAADSIRSAAESAGAGSPEAEFAANWAVGAGWQAAFAERIEAYLAKAAARLDSDDGFEDYVRLAESRRRDIRKHPLSEFDLLLPRTNIGSGAPALEMQPDGTVRPRAA